MGRYGAPGGADADAPETVVGEWNALIDREMSRQGASPILKADPNDIPGGQVLSAVTWPGHPLEPLNCQDEDIAAELSDWGWQGRAELHNEYLEYALIMRSDATGALRPKRFVATTELMEWWMTMAVHAPNYFLSRVEAVTGQRLGFADIFQRSEAQWKLLSVSARQSEFLSVLVGEGRTRPPTHPLNRDHLLFMAHGINGLDDLIYVVHFGSFPYAVREGGVRRRARMEEIFAKEGRADLFCRNADPAAAEGAYNQAFLSGTEASPKARDLAFADPLGMYIRSFGVGDLFLDGQPVPESWTRWSRGEKATRQRLEFGPSDEEPVFLDDVTIGREEGAARLSGYQIAKRIEVGPLVVVGEPKAIEDADFKEIPAVESESIECGLEGDARCAQIASFKAEYENRQRSLRSGTRGGAVG